MGNRIAEIDELLKRAGSALFQIEEEYSNSLSRKSINVKLKSDMKKYCEDLWPILDYLAREIGDKYCRSNLEAKVYFPILLDSKDFHKHMGRQYSELKDCCKGLYDYLEAVQPYQKKGNEWLYYFSRLSNEKKYENLVEQTKKATKRINVSAQNNRLGKFGAGGYMGRTSGNPQIQVPYTNSSQKIETTTWVDFKFEGIDVSAIWLLEKSLKGIEDIFETIRKWL